MTKEFFEAKRIETIVGGTHVEERTWKGLNHSKYNRRYELQVFNGPLGMVIWAYSPESKTFYVVV